jgi:hypothetical protein
MRRTAFTRSSRFGAGKATIVDFEKRGEEILASIPRKF